LPFLIIEANSLLIFPPLFPAMHGQGRSKFRYLDSLQKAGKNNEANIPDFGEIAVRAEMLMCLQAPGGGSVFSRGKRLHAGSTAPFDIVRAVLQDWGTDFHLHACPMDGIKPCGIQGGSPAAHDQRWLLVRAARQSAGLRSLQQAGEKFFFPLVFSSSANFFGVGSAPPPVFTGLFAGFDPFFPLFGAQQTDLSLGGLRLPQKQKMARVRGFPTAC
jgi:hypothetical protein